MDKKVLKNCYKILAVMQHNTERRTICAEIFRDVLCNNRKLLEIRTLARKTIKNEIHPKSQKDEENRFDIFSSSWHFKFLDNSFILNTRLDSPEILEYIKKRYFVYDSLFKDVYPISMEEFTLIASIIVDTLTDRIIEAKYSFKSYQFENKMEYGDLGFIKIPERKYISNWSRVITFTKKDIQDRLPKDKFIDLDFFFDVYSFTQAQIQSEPKLRFQERPIFKLNDTTFILAFPFLLIRCLPQKFEFLLRRIKNYSGLRGQTFEEISLELFDLVLCKKFRKNFVYDPSEGEIDGILEFENNFWLIECKSRPPSIKSLQGDNNSIQNDIKKTVRASETQIGKALKNIQKLKIDKKAIKNPGCIIVLEGIFPQLNTTTYFCAAKNKLGIPRLIINYFDLKDLVHQPNSYLFEEFLIWRTQKDMPIMCHDELDYWIFFSKYGDNPKVQESLKKAIRNQNLIIYRGW